MEWTDLLKSPTAMLATAVSSLSTVVGILWKRCRDYDKTIAKKDRMIADLNEKRVKDLRQIANLDD